MGGPGRGLVSRPDQVWSATPVPGGGQGALSGDAGGRWPAEAKALRRSVFGEGAEAAGVVAGAEGRGWALGEAGPEGGKEVLWLLFGVR